MVRAPCDVICISPETRVARDRSSDVRRASYVYYDYVLEREYRRARRLYITVYTTAVCYAQRGGEAGFSII